MMAYHGDVPIGVVEEFLKANPPDVLTVVEMREVREKMARAPGSVRFDVVKKKKE